MLTSASRPEERDTLRGRMRVPFVFFAALVGLIVLREEVPAVGPWIAWALLVAVLARSMGPARWRRKPLWRRSQTSALTPVADRWVGSRWFGLPIVGGGLALHLGAEWSLGVSLVLATMLTVWPLLIFDGLRHLFRRNLVEPRSIFARSSR